MSKQQVTVPDIGGAEDAEVVELLVAVGDEVTLDQSLIVLESDKASMEIPSTVAGTVIEVLVAEGEQLAEGSPVVVVEVAGESAEDEPVEDEPVEIVEENATIGPVLEPVAQPGEPTGRAAESSVTTTAVSIPEVPVPAVDMSAPTGSSGIYAGPAVRKLAREFGIELGKVVGSGPRGRVIKEDLHQFVKKSLSGESAVAATGGAGIPAIPEIDFSKFGPVAVTERSKLDKLTAANMQRNWLNVPHVTQFDEADITELEEFRAGLKAEAQRRGTRLTPMPFLLKACAVALCDNPKLNSSLAQGGAELVYKQYMHIGMAVDTPAGLVVPVLRDVDKKTIWELAEEVLAMAGKARDRKLMPADMQGGCFTVSSLGNIGGTGFTPIVNAPQVGILGVSKAALKPVWDGQAFAPRKLLPLALSYDHRVVNGGDAGRFLSQLVVLMGDIRQLVM